MIGTKNGGRSESTYATYALANTLTALLLDPRAAMSRLAVGLSCQSR